MTLTRNFSVELPDDMTDEEAMRYMRALNRIARLARWRHFWNPKAPEVLIRREEQLVIEAIEALNLKGGIGSDLQELND